MGAADLGEEVGVAAVDHGPGDMLGHGRRAAEPAPGLLHVAQRNLRHQPYDHGLAALGVHEFLFVHELGGQVLPKLDQELAIGLGQRPVRLGRGPPDRLGDALRGRGLHDRHHALGGALPGHRLSSRCLLAALPAISQHREDDGQHREHDCRGTDANPRHQHEVEEGIDALDAVGDAAARQGVEEARECLRHQRGHDDEDKQRSHVRAHGRAR